jgi:hypothetical protein
VKLCIDIRAIRRAAPVGRDYAANLNGKLVWTPAIPTRKEFDVGTPVYGRVLTVRELRCGLGIDP